MLRQCSLPVLLAVTVLICSGAFGQEIQDEWKYSVRKPAAGWQKVDFDDSAWKTGNAGFGTRETPNARVGTVWATNNIWLRKTFRLEQVPDRPALLIHHDEDAQVFINGQSVAEVKGFTTDYKVIPIPPAKHSALKSGTNLMAVHCRQTNGGQFIDVHVVDANKVPTLPVPPRNTKPFESNLITKWGAEVTAANAWTDYPRPQLKRNNWTNLNGHWDYAVTTKDQQTTPTEWSGKILVPFCLESKLGGVQRLLDATEALWYRRTFSTRRSGDRVKLNFEAVDYRCEAFVNGHSVGEHVGGNLPFSFDITDALVDGQNELVVRVEDATEEWQLRGKQVLNARGIWYTQVSGIWQTVWLEEVPQTSIEDVTMVCSLKNSQLNITVDIKGADATSVQVQLLDPDSADNGPLAAGNSVPLEGSTAQLVVSTEGLELWSPEAPKLYDVRVTVKNAEDKALDSVASYIGIREVGKIRDADGHWRFTLNGKPIFHWGPLDQGWWPDGLLTPPSDEAMLFDIQWLKKAGFNMIRKHIKVEPRRYYYHCDRLGMMVWQDHVSGGKGRNQGWPNWTRLKPSPTDAQWPARQHDQFMKELDEMIDSLENHPSIVSWVPFNEAWGQHRTMDVGRWTVKRDPSRIINVASGGNFWPVGDVVDEHSYPHPSFPFDLNTNGRFDDYIKVIGEFGGHGFPVKDHLWDANRRNWGYGDIPKSLDEFKARYQQSLNMLNDLRSRGIAAGVYTQTTDVEGEINGLMTYDRKVMKISAAELAKLHQPLFQKAPKNSSAQSPGDSTQPSRQPPTGQATSKEEAMADQFPSSAFIEVPTNRKPGPAMTPEEIAAGLKSHDRALFVKTGWIRDPYITRGPDDYFYLTGTQPNEGDPRETSNPYNIGLGDASIVGNQVRAYRSRDLIHWESMGIIFSSKDLFQPANPKAPRSAKRIWAPEVHWLENLGQNGRWALVHCPKNVASLALSAGPQLKGPWNHPMKNKLGPRHDPSLFTDDDGTRYLLWGNTNLAPLNDDLTAYTAKPVRIDPSGSRPGPDGKLIRRIGHEGATMIKVGSKYVHLGTAWSTDQGRQGSYNLYYSTADQITGPYGPRQFAGRFLGHGTPFQDRSNRWWCTAFFNANLPPLSTEGIQNRDLGDNAQTINEQGLTIVPLEVKMTPRGDVFIRAKDPHYANPGPDEAQDFAKVGPE